LRIVVCSLNFRPDLTGTGKYTGEMTAWLRSQGHEVFVITAPPFYPAWKVAPGYSRWWYRKERQGGDASGSMGEETVYRCPLYVPARDSGIRRILHLLSFAFSSAPVLLRLTFKKPDVVWMVEPTLAVAPFAWLSARLSRARLWLHVQDLEVDMAFDLGLLRAGFMRRAVLALERLLMRRFDRVSTISGAMRARLLEKGVRLDQVRDFPNWADIDGVHPLARPSAMREHLGLPDDAVVALYSGNMGQKQGLETVVEAARLLQSHEHVRFVLCGEGAARARLEDLASGLSNVQWLPLQPLDQLNELLNLADIHLLPQRADAADRVMPSKLTNMLASGRPVVATALPGTEVHAVVSGRGINTPPGDAARFAAAIEHLASDATLRRDFGAAARRYAEEHLGKDRILQQFERDLQALSGNR
jgi:colanic acid biosynthesis glycosyl transferase WcaI